MDYFLCKELQRHVRLTPVLDLNWFMRYTKRYIYFAKVLGFIWVSDKHKHREDIMNRLRRLCKKHKLRFIELSLEGKNPGYVKKIGEI